MSPDRFGWGRRTVLGATVAAGASLAGCSLLPGQSGPDRPDYGALREVLQARSVADGSLRWEWPVEKGTRVWPAAGDGSVYVSTPDESTLLALSASDGSERWRYSVEGSVGTPAVADGTLYLPTEGDPPAIRAVESGREQWRTEFQSPLGPGAAPPTVADGVVYLRRRREKALDLVGLSTADGGRAFETEVDVDPRVADLSASYPYQAGFVVGDQRIYLSHATRTAGIDLRTGETAFTFGGNYTLGRPVLADGTVVVGESSSDVGRSAAYGLDSADGTRRWTYGDDAAARAVAGPHEGRVYVGTRTSESVSVLKPSNGYLARELSLPGRLDTMTLSDGRLYAVVVGTDGEASSRSLLAVGPDGRLKWTVTLDKHGPMGALPPVAGDDTVFVTAYRLAES